SLLEVFLNDFLENLWNYQLKNAPRNVKEFGEKLLENLLSYKDLRDNYILFLFEVTKLEYELDVDTFINFFEKFPIYRKPRDFGINGGSYYDIDFENFKVVFQELFLYTIAIGIKNNNFSLISDLLHSGYFFNHLNGRNAELEKFHELYSHCDGLQNYYKELHNKISGFGEYIITNLNSKIDKDEIIFADLLCHYISELESKNYKKWFPRLYIYKNEYESFDFFIKLSSNRYFNKVKDLFNVEDLESFKTLINNYKLLIEK